MAHLLREVGLDFVGAAPVRHVFARETAAPPEAVYSALAEDVAGWTQWYGAVTLARPLDGGARREIRLMGGTRFEETVLAAERPEVYAYRVDLTNAPGSRAIVEEWRLAPAGAGTRVQWTIAVDGTAPFRTSVRLARPGLARAFRGAVTSLDRRLAASAS
ncbi:MULTISPECIES: SRPBCC family protein [unclassified Streptomyces]|uniref:SRPBCC family protein n=1 Tax=Streptomyces sp. SS1-1 TaxID=2651869 RepID=UPI00125042EF|nr:SRPBCC family protein [Streptomyces sp. SS1-1]KAB2971328.1 SRPBCC family protein [Streptomyces sp. SS1-1]